MECSPAEQYPRRMLRLLGIPVSDDDVRHLVATLIVEGTPDALTAAGQITKAVERDLYAVGLSPGEGAEVSVNVRWRVDDSPRASFQTGYCPSDARLFVCVSCPPGMSDGGEMIRLR